jgi:pimeloyl-ACP methyl ester carboxylesterase
MPFVDLPGVRLRYEDTGGTGPAVVFLHAASGMCESWIDQQSAFTAAGYRCIFYDRRGWGQSLAAPTGPQPGNAAEDLHGLLAHLGVQSFHLVATAAGGVVAFDYALEHPQALASLVVADTISGVQDPEYLQVQHRMRPPAIDALPMELRELSAGYRGLNPEGMRRWIEIEHASLQPGETRLQQKPRAPMTYARLETLRVPVLLLAGEADLRTPPALMRLVAAHIPRCEFKTIPEAGHAAHWEQPDVWNRLVIEFITRCGQ